MKKKKLIGLISVVTVIGVITAFSMSFIDGDKAEEQRRRDSAIYLLNDGDSDEKLSLLEDGKVINIGKSLFKSTFYSEETGEYISVTCC